MQLHFLPVYSSFMQLIGAPVTFNECQWELLHSSYRVVRSWSWKHGMHSSLFIYHVSNVLFVLIQQATVEFSGDIFWGIFHKPYLTLANCNLSFEEGVSFCNLPLYSYSLDKPIYQKGFLPTQRFLMLWGETLIYLLWCTLTYDICL